MNELLETIPDRTDVEIILVDDRSTVPYTPTITFHKATVTTITNGPGQKYAGTARNEGIRHAQGEWIIFADSDDKFTDVLETMMVHVSKMTKTDQVLFYLTSFTTDGEEGTRHNYVNGVIKKFAKTGKAETLLHHYCSPGRFLRKEFIVTNSIAFEKRRHCEDNVFTTKIATLAPRTTVLDQTGYQIREDDTSLSTQRTEEAIYNKLSAIIESNRIIEQSQWPNLIYSPYSAARDELKHNPKQTLKALSRILMEGNLPFYPIRVLKWLASPLKRFRK